MDIHKLYKPILTHFRRRRMRRFAQLFSMSEHTTVLDLGGGPFNWTLLARKPRLTILDINSKIEGAKDGVVYVRGDACSVSFPDKSFDVVFSNSVIEHVGGCQRQVQFARECMRCGRGFYVQTPNQWFPVDPHTFLPLAHWLPKKIFTKIMWISPRFLLSRPSEEDILDFRNMRMLSERELRQLFPGARIIKERWWGMTKSLIAVSAEPSPGKNRQSAS